MFSRKIGKQLYSKTYDIHRTLFGETNLLEIITIVDFQPISLFTQCPLLIPSTANIPIRFISPISALNLKINPNCEKHVASITQSQH